MYTPENKESRDQVIAASYKAFEILRLYPIPKSRDEQIQFVFRIASLAYCGERWSDLGRWFSDNSSLIDETPVEQESWDHHILSHLYFCWTRLFRQRFPDLTLTRFWKQFPNCILHKKNAKNNFFDELEPEQATRIMLFVWPHFTIGSDAPRLLLNILLTGESDGNPLGQIDMYFERATEAAKICGEWQIEYILAWLHSTSRIMITSSLWWRFRNRKILKQLNLLKY